VEQLNGKIAEKEISEHLEQAKGDLSWLRNLKKVTRERENYFKEAGDCKKPNSTSEEENLRRILLFEVHPNELKRRSSLQ